MSFTQPNYALLANLPVADPIGAGLKTYTTLQAQQRAQKLADLQTKLGGLQQQQLQQEIKAYPTEETLRQQKAKLGITTAKIGIKQAQKTIAQQDLAHIAALPADLQEHAYQHFRNDSIAMGASPDDLPETYTPEMQNLSKQYLAALPSSQKQQQFQYDLAKQRLKNAGLIGAATLKARATLQAAAKKAKATDPFLKAQAIQLSKDVSDYDKAGREAQDIALPKWKEIQQLIEHVQTDPITGHVIFTSDERQALDQLFKQVQLMETQKFHYGRMQIREFNQILKSVGDMTMYRSVLRKTVQRHLNEIRKAIDLQNFANEYVKKGGRSTQELTRQWIKKRQKEEPLPVAKKVTGAKEMPENDPLGIR